MTCMGVTLICACAAGGLMGCASAAGANQQTGHTVATADPIAAVDPVAAGPRISLTVLPSYLRGFPMMVALTVDNPDSSAFFTRLPDIGWFASSDLAGWTLRDAKGNETTISHGLLPEESEHDGGFALDHGDARTMLVDIAAFGRELPAGVNELQAAYLRVSA